jgi:hypothetical protein
MNTFPEYLLLGSTFGHFNVDFFDLAIDISLFLFSLDGGLLRKSNISCGLRHTLLDSVDHIT